MNTAGLPEAPFTIGQVLWLPRVMPERMTVVCPICNGDRRVTVILGSSEHVLVQCDGCGLGYEGPRGVIDEYQFTPGASRFEVAAIVSFHDGTGLGEWRVRSTDGREDYYASLYQTEAEAVAMSTKACADQADQQMMRRAHRKKGLSKAAWTVRYHREQIREAERSLAWHRERVQAIITKRKGDDPDPEATT